MTKEQIVNRIEKIQDEIKYLRDEQITLQKKLDEIIVNENTQSLLNEIYYINNDNTMSVHLYQDTRTTPIMDKFYHSDKKFLILDNIFSVGKNFTKISLVVTKNRQQIDLINSNLTMTNLKDKNGITINDYLVTPIFETSRFYSLAKEILIASEKITDKDTKISFEKPIRLGGQTFANQTGYGSTYEGKYQITQGTLYGETTSFCIIGIIAK